MTNSHKPPSSPCRALARAPLLLALIALAGCKASPAGMPIGVNPEVQLVKPERRDLHHKVGQPGYIYAFEQTSIYPKITGFIQKWYVDIGDKIKEGQLLADLFVPELHARYQQKIAEVKLGKERVRLAESLVEVAKNNVTLAAADVVQAKADVKKYVAEVERWQSEVQRLSKIVKIIDKQVLEEARLRLKSDVAARNAAEAGVQAARVRELARQSDLAKARVDVDVARAQVEVDEAAKEDLKALVAYTHLHAPYDGVVIIRNANKGDYVEPRYGDASVPRGGYAAEARTQGTPIYVVARTNEVRVYVDVPEMEANYVHGKTAAGPGNDAHVRIQALDDADISGNVVRTSWALDFRSRTLRAEIDLPNKDARLLPGMYAFGEVMIDRKHVLTLPADAVLEIGNENCCYLYEDGKAIRTPVQTGIRAGKWIEVFRKQVKGEWVRFTGTEEIILGDLAELRDGEKVEVTQSKSIQKEEEHTRPENKEKR
jgi:HlyD family secretion protein